MSRRQQAAWARDYRDTRVLVLGAAGFIGRWVARSLCAHGARLILVVRDEIAARRIFSEYGVDGEIIVADLQRRGSTTRIVESVRPSVTFNLAGYGVDHSEHDDRLAQSINVALVGEVCEAVGRCADSPWPGERLVHAGSMAEYGPIGGTLREDRVCAPTTLYGKSKLAGTACVSEYCEEHGLNAVTARIFWVYGPGEQHGRLLRSLIETARAKRPLELTTGEQPGDFSHVEDVAEGLLRLGATRGRPGEIVNLATGTLTRVRDFAATAARLLDIPGDHLRFGARPQRGEAEVGLAGVDVTRLRHRIGWAPSSDVATGIARTLSFLRNG